MFSHLSILLLPVAFGARMGPVHCSSAGHKIVLCIVTLITNTKIIIFLFIVAATQDQSAMTS
jgi:hypothetical protein